MTAVAIATPAAGESTAKARFAWDDPLLLEEQLTEEERMVRDTARAYARERLMPRDPGGQPARAVRSGDHARAG